MAPEAPGSLPIVSFGFAAPRTLAAITGAMQMKPMGFFAAWISLMSLATSGFTVQSGPFTAKSQRFLAAPNPPGKMRASMSAAFTSFMFLMSPRAMRADSHRTFLDSPLGCPFVWSITCIWLTSGAMQRISAPALSRK